MADAVEGSAASLAGEAASAVGEPPEAGEWSRDMHDTELIESIDTDAIEAAIAAAEKNCSGEIRVHIETTIGAHEIREFGERVFNRLGMTKTADRNGVLIFLAAEEQQFVILGDEGIHAKVGDEFWERVAAEMTREFRHGRFTAGLVAAISEAGERLSEFFPYQRDDVDELSNQVSFGSQSRHGMSVTPQPVVIALGSNMGNRCYELRRAIYELRRHVRIVRLSPVLETAPVDAPSGSGDFLNMVVAGLTSLSPENLLKFLQRD